MLCVKVWRATSYLYHVSLDTWYLVGRVVRLSDMRLKSRSFAMKAVPLKVPKVKTMVGLPYLVLRLAVQSWTKRERKTRSRPRQML